MFRCGFFFLSYAGMVSPSAVAPVHSSGTKGFGEWAQTSAGEPWREAPVPCSCPEVQLFGIIPLWYGLAGSAIQPLPWAWAACSSVELVCFIFSLKDELHVLKDELHVLKPHSVSVWNNFLIYFLWAGTTCVFTVSLPHGVVLSTASAYPVETASRPNNLQGSVLQKISWLTW